MIKQPLWVSMLVLCMLLLGVTSKAYAELVPRIAYVIPSTDGTTDQPNYMGKYWYLGVGFLDTSGGGLIGPSIRYGFGDTGKKLNISYLAGGDGLSLEGGISYFRQDTNAVLLVDPSYEGFAFEASIRYGISSAIFTTTGSSSTVEFALGF
ncbi:MAG: hypothetical protein Q9N62_07965 [Ghiorsea sp.]|nr:hypothetical protein [Ghiorsea sp.]